MMRVDSSSSSSQVEASQRRLAYRPVVFGSAQHKSPTTNPRVLARVRNISSPSYHGRSRPQCSEKLVCIVISEGGARLARVKPILERAGCTVLHFPAIFARPPPPCKGYEGLRLAMRNAWTSIVATGVSAAVFEDDVALHRRFEGQSDMKLSKSLCSYIARSRARGADVAYLGHLSSGNVKWGCHALWITPYAAEYLLNDTRACYMEAKDSQDSNVVTACRRQKLACAYTGEYGSDLRFQKGHNMGGRDNFYGYFVQDRINVVSYLHSRTNQAASANHVHEKRRLAG